MNWAIKIISKTLMTKIFPISWVGYDKGGFDKGFYGNWFNIINFNRFIINLSLKYSIKISLYFKIFSLFHLYPFKNINSILITK